MPRKVAKIVRSPKTQRTLPFRHHSGIHTIHLMVPARPYPIQRFIDTAPDGMLAIGNTKDLAQMIRRARSSLKDPKRTGGWAMFHHLCTRLQKACRYRKKHLKPSVLGNLRTKHSGLVRKELRAIEGFIDQYGEPPHSNNKIPGGCKE